MPWICLGEPWSRIVIGQRAIILNWQAKDAWWHLRLRWEPGLGKMSKWEEKVLETQSKQINNPISQKVDERQVTVCPVQESHFIKNAKEAVKQFVKY